MSDDEWRVPAPREDPEIYRARLVRDEKGARLVPGDDIVEGGTEGGGEPAPKCPFSSS